MQRYAALRDRTDDQRSFAPIQLSDPSCSPTPTSGSDYALKIANGQPCIDIVVQPPTQEERWLIFSSHARLGILSSSIYLATGTVVMRPQR